MINKPHYWMIAAALTAVPFMHGCQGGAPVCPREGEPEKTQEWPRNSRQCVVPCDAGTIRIDAEYCCNPAEEVCPSPATVTISPSGSSFTGTTSFSASAIDALGLSYRVDGNSFPGGNGDFGSNCTTDYDGSAFLVKDTSYISVKSLGDDDRNVWSYSDAINRKRITINNPTYPNSVLKAEFRAAEAFLQNKVICDSGIALPADPVTGICYPDVDPFNEAERNAFLFTYHFWETDCPVSGKMYMTWRYYGPYPSYPTIPDIRITLSYQACVVKDSNGFDMTISNMLNGGIYGSEAIVDIGSYNLFSGRVNFDTTTHVAVSGAIDGVVREDAMREYSLLQLVEVPGDRVGTSYVGCQSTGCALGGAEVRYTILGSSYTMYDPDSMAADSCN